MTNIDYKLMLDRCNLLTQNGATLSINWYGGNDSGQFIMALDEKEMAAELPVDQEIVDLIERELGYCSFAGEFSADGSVVYNREEGCFSGSDSYQTSSYDTKECAIKVRVAKDIWFERLDIGIAIGGEDDARDGVRLTVLNGPRIGAHFTAEEDMVELVSERMGEVMEGTEDWSDAQISASISVKDFEAEGEDLVYTITGIFYNFCEYENKDVIISLTDKIEEDDNI